MPHFAHCSYCNIPVRHLLSPLLRCLGVIQDSAGGNYKAEPAHRLVILHRGNVPG